MNPGDLDFLQALVAAQKNNPQNAAIFNMALERAGGLFQDPEKQRKDQLVDMLTKAQVGRFAETGDTNALNMISTLLEAEDPITALRGYEPSGTEGLMKQAQAKFDEGISPYVKEAIGGGDIETASRLSEYTPEALTKLRESQQELETSARDTAEFEKNQQQGGDLAARINFALRGLNPSYAQGAAPTQEQKARALREKVKSIYDEIPR